MPAGSSSSSDPGAATRPWHERLPSTGIVVTGLVVLALGLRLWELDERAMHHDESLDAWWSWLFRNGRYERYDPVYHGPLRFYITAGFYELFGESEAVARLLSAVTGTAAVGLPWFLRRELGRAGTIAAAAALTISPTMLYYSRFGREDAQMVFLTLLSLVLGIAYKKNVDDMRESPSVEIMQQLQDLGSEVSYCDPLVPVFPKMRKYEFDLESESFDAESIASHDCVVIATNHDVFDWNLLSNNAKAIVDTRGVFREKAKSITPA